MNKTKKTVKVKTASSSKTTLPLAELTLLSTRIKNMHVETKLYSAHKALDEAFDALNESMDSFMECVQGYYDDLPIDRTPITFAALPIEDLKAECVRMTREFIELAQPLVEPKDSRDETYIEGINSALCGARDEVVLNFLQLKYLLNRRH